MDHHIRTGQDASSICRKLAHLARAEDNHGAARELSVAAMLCTRWAAELHASGDPQDPTAVVVAHPSQRNRRQWGRYVNRILIYTPPHLRQARTMRTLDRTVAAHYAEQGLSRVRTLSTSPDNYALHRAYGWTAWAIDARGHIVHDAALAPHLDHQGVPPYAADLGATRPLHIHEIQAALTAPSGPYLPQT